MDMTDAATTTQTSEDVEDRLRMLEHGVWGIEMDLPDPAATAVRLEMLTERVAELGNIVDQLRRAVAANTECIRILAEPR